MSATTSWHARARSSPPERRSARGSGGRRKKRRDAGVKRGPRRPRGPAASRMSELSFATRSSWSSSARAPIGSPDSSLRRLLVDGAGTDRSRRRCSELPWPATTMPSLVTLQPSVQVPQIVPSAPARAVRPIL